MSDADFVGALFSAVEQSLTDVEYRQHELFEHAYGSETRWLETVLNRLGAFATPRLLELASEVGLPNSSPVRSLAESGIGWAIGQSEEMPFEGGVLTVPTPTLEGVSSFLNQVRPDVERLRTHFSAKRENDPRRHALDSFRRIASEIPHFRETAGGVALLSSMGEPFPVETATCEVHDLYRCVADLAEEAGLARPTFPDEITNWGQWDNALQALTRFCTESTQLGSTLASEADVQDATAEADMGATHEHPNGPEGGQRYWYNGRSTPLSGRTYQVVEVMEAHEFLSLASLQDRVIDSQPVSDATISTWANRANNALSSLEVPWRYRVDTVNRYFRKEPIE